MKNFRYRVKNADGEEQQGSLQAESKEEAETTLVHRDLIVLSLSEVEEGHDGEKEKKKTSPSRKKQDGAAVKTEELASFLYEMSILLDAGIMLPDAIELYISGESKSALERQLVDVLKDIRSGTLLSDAMLRRPRIFPPICGALVKSGETSGRMSQMFVQLSKHFEEAEAVRNRIVSAASYPLIVAIMAVVIIFGLIFFVAPKFAQIYLQIGLPIPAATMIFLDIGKYSDVIFAVLAVLAVASIFASVWFRTSARGQLAFDRLKLHLPIVGPVMRRVAVAGFCHTLSMLYDSGVKVYEAVDLAAEASGNRFLTARLRKIREGLHGGQQLSAAIKGDKLFTEQNLGMIRAGEKSGELAKMLGKLGDIISSQEENRIKKLLSMLEPALITMVAVFVGGTVLALAAPILNLPALLQQ